MAADPQGLPAFGKPPVGEVVLAVHFDPPLKLQVFSISQLWEKWRGRFPSVQEHPELPPLPDELSRGPVAPAIEFQVVDVTGAASPPRFWFLNETGSELVQVQRDRLVHNWRRLDPDSPYPHYENLRPAFRDDLIDFQAFLAESQAGKFSPYQCEISYINPIQIGLGLEDFGQLHRLIAPWSGQFSEPFLADPESVSIAVRFLMTDTSGKTAGRLHISANPVQSQVDGTSAVLLQLAARGRPYDQSIDGVLQFLDLGHDWIVRAFAAITTPEMHDLWERQNG
jgi:uncharacterized protein (TIGR04255 family)